MGDPRVSVVVPVYNVEKYLAKCVDSVLTQTYENVEVILVDDATLDASGIIADEYTQKDSRVKVIHKRRNEGLNSARWTGLKASSGVYVMFVDSDDVLMNDCIEMSVKLIRQHDTDFVKFNFSKFKDDASLKHSIENVSEQKKHIEKTVSGKKDLYSTRFKNEIVGPSVVCVWGGLYSAKLLRKLDWRAANYRINEDNFWMLEFFDQANTGVYTSRVGYLYRSDDSYTGVLSKTLIGNSVNGTPVGYLEFLVNYFKVFRKYNKKYSLNLDEEINALEAWTLISRLRSLVEADKVTTENNAEFVAAAASHLFHQYDKEKAASIASANALRSLIDENKKLKQELKSLHSVKRSARLLAGNLKRKVRSIGR